MQIPGGPKMARAALRRRAIDISGDLAEKQGDACFLFSAYADHLWPVQTTVIHGPFRRAKMPRLIWEGLTVYAGMLWGATKLNVFYEQ